MDYRASQGRRGAWPVPSAIQVNATVLGLCCLEHHCSSERACREVGLGPPRIREIKKYNEIGDRDRARVATSTDEKPNRGSIHSIDARVGEGRELAAALTQSRSIFLNP